MDNVVAMADLLTEFWREIAKPMPDWDGVLKRHKHANEQRAEIAAELLEAIAKK